MDLPKSRKYKNTTIQNYANTKIPEKIRIQQNQRNNI